MATIRRTPSVMKLAVGWAMVIAAVFGLAIGFATDATGLASGLIGIGCGVLGILGGEAVERIVKDDPDAERG